jgi:hypothetical protein
LNPNEYIVPSLLTDGSKVNLPIQMLKIIIDSTFLFDLGFSVPIYLPMYLIVIYVGYIKFIVTFLIGSCNDFDKGFLFNSLVL